MIGRMTFLISELPDRIARRIVVDPETGCWLWQGARTHRQYRGGYGAIKWQGKMLGVHRVVYTLLVAPIPDGLTIDHVKARGCRYAACCWPEHLEPVTQGENSRRGDTPWTANSHKTHCKHGHEFTPANTYRDKAGVRQCRMCGKLKMRRRQGYTGIGSPQVRNAAKTHCKRGHEFTPSNTYRAKDGSRHCRRCGAIKQQRYLERKRARQAIQAARNDS
jgi:hypothetical protein